MTKRRRKGAEATPKLAKPELHAAPIRSRRLSGRNVAIWVVICLAMTALLIPMVLKLPTWIEVEIVLGTWWLIWCVVLIRILFMGMRVSDDHKLGQPTNWFASWFSSNQSQNHSSSSSGFEFSGGDGEGCLVFLGILLALAVLVIGLWVLIEIAIPVIAFLLYIIVRSMLAIVANDRHRCRGSMLRAALWGVIWATLYTLPLAGAVWLVHRAS